MRRASRACVLLTACTRVYLYTSRLSIHLQWRQSGWWERETLLQMRFYLTGYTTLYRALNVLVSKVLNCLSISRLPHRHFYILPLKHTQYIYIHGLYRYILYAFDYLIFRLNGSHPRMVSDLSVCTKQNYIQTELAYWVGCDTLGKTKLFSALNDVIIPIYIHFLATERIAYIRFDELIKLFVSRVTDFFSTGHMRDKIFRQSDGNPFGTRDGKPQRAVLGLCAGAIETLNTNKSSTNHKNLLV